MTESPLGRILDDLFTIEVNVVVKDSMTARKMPEPAHALLDIIDEYDVHLLRVGGALDTLWQGDPPVQVRRPSEPGSSTAGSRSHRRTDPDGFLRVRLATDPVPDRIHRSTFQLLGERARESEAVLRYLLTTDVADELDPAEALILKRIFRNCDQLKAVVGDPAVARILDEGVGRGGATGLDLRLPPDSVLVVRKVWDLGVETVALQTVAQLDGDVVTRIQRARLNAMSPVLLDLHREALDSSLGHWDRLFAILAQLATDTFRSLLRR